MDLLLHHHCGSKTDENDLWLLWRAGSGNTTVSGYWDWSTPTCSLCPSQGYGKHQSHQGKSKGAPPSLLFSYVGTLFFFVLKISALGSVWEFVKSRQFECRIFIWIKPALLLKFQSLVMLCNSWQTGVRDLSWFLQVQPLRLTSKYIHIKSHVENYLNAAFYNHAAVSLHNWKVRGEVVMGLWELALDWWERDWAVVTLSGIFVLTCVRDPLPSAS